MSKSGARRARRDKARATAPPQAPARGSPGLVVQARYDAAGQGRRLAEWRPPSTGPNKAIQGLQTIRNRSRDAGRNEWAGASSGRTMVTSLIGTGIVARPKTKDTTLKASLQEKWGDFIKASDADGVLDFYGQQVLGTWAWVQAGEFFARARSRRITDGLPVPMQVQLLEADMCPIFDVDSWPGMSEKHKIRQGIELDRVGRRVAYWMHREHPGDTYNASVSIHDLVRIPADQIAHVYRPGRIGQLRGVPESASILAKLRTVMNFDDNVLTRQQIANLFMMFIERPMPGGDGTQIPIDPLTGKAVEYNSNGAQVASMEPAISQELLPGEKATFSNPPDAGANYAEFMRMQNLGLAAGQGQPYELMTGDIKDVSDRTLRIVINEFRRYCEQLQWTILIPQFCERVRAWWAQAGLISGELSQEEFDEAFKTEWSPQAWARIHPTQDVDAEVKEVEAGFRSRSSVIASRGYDPDDVDAERAADQEREDDLGLTPPPPPASPQEPEETDEQREVRENLNQLGTEFRAFASRPAPQAQQPVQVHIAGAQVQLPPMQLANEINLPAPVVSVQAAAAPEVKVVNDVHVPAQEAPVVNVEVAAPKVDVQVTNEMPEHQTMEIVAMPTRKTTTKIERDQDDNIRTTTQIEMDLGSN